MCLCPLGAVSSPLVQGCHGNTEVGSPSAVCGDLIQAFAMLWISVRRQLTCAGVIIGHIWYLSALKCSEIMKLGSLRLLEKSGH